MFTANFFARTCSITRDSTNNVLRVFWVHLVLTRIRHGGSLGVKWSGGEESPCDNDGLVYGLV